MKQISYRLSSGVEMTKALNYVLNGADVVDSSFRRDLEVSSVNRLVP